MKVFRFILIAVPFLSHAQDLLQPEEAIRIGLEKNYSVVLMRNSSEVAALQNNSGNAGLSPTVTLNANLNLSSLNSRQEFATGGVQDRTGAFSNSAGVSLNASWIVFDGMRMFAVKKRLELNEDLSALELRAQMENTVYEIITFYYDIVRIRELIKAAQQNLKIYEERKKIATLKLEIGSDSKVDLLLTRSDENKAKSDIMRLELEMLGARVTLNKLLSRAAGTDFTTIDSIVVDYDPTLEDLRKNYPSRNSSILVSKKAEEIFSEGIREARSAMLPSIQVNGSYLFTRSRAQAGFVLLNRQSGLNGGIGASWLLFNGSRNNKLVKERNLLYLNQRILSEQTELEVDAGVFLSYKAFQLSTNIVKLERANMADAKEVLEISLERYRIGKATLLETIETQQNLEDAQVRYINALYGMKVAEAELLRINGNLVKTP